MCTTCAVYLTHFFKSSQQYVAKNKNFEAPRYAIFSSHLSFRFNTELNTLFSNILDLCSSVWLKNQASKPYKKRYGQGVYILIRT